MLARWRNILVGAAVSGPPIGAPLGTLTGVSAMLGEATRSFVIGLRRFGEPAYIRFSGRIRKCLQRTFGLVAMPASA
jgi:hypothetical protein